jgi:hypothetical protein
MTESAVTDRYAIYNADTVDVARELPTASVGFSVFSPPFSSLYTYSNSARDMGNARDDAEFWAHYEYLIAEQARVMMPGRLIAIHCMQLASSKERHGYIGVRDFRGDIIRAYQRHGFIYHSEVAIWKCPVVAMQRSKALGLLHKQIKKDSAMSRQGFCDYLVIMRAPGGNDEPITHTNETFPVALWQRYASPVWAHASGDVDPEGFLVLDAKQVPGDDSSGIDPGDTLQYRSAREHDDERHICPLQLEVIRRAMRLWSNPGDLVWSPFAGIGSEGFVALQEGRRFVGAELKASYYAQAVKNLTTASVPRQRGLFDDPEAA